MKQKILFLSEYDWASIGLRLCEAINKYTDWEAHCVSSYNNLIPNPLLSTIPANEPKIRELMKTADVIIYGCSFYDWKPFNEKFKPGALVGIMHVGSMYRGNSDYYNKLIHPKLDFVVVSYDFQDVCPGSIVVLNPIDETKYTPVKRNDTPPVLVGHSPSGWGKKLESGAGRILKGTHHLTTAMEILNKKYGDKICVDIIQGVSLPNCLARKKRCHIFFDQIGDKTAYKKAPGERPLYGTSLAEAAFFGSICLSHADIPNSPFYCVKNSDDIVRVISHFMDNPEQIEIVGQKTREWALQNLSYESVGKKFIADLEAKINESSNSIKK